jgi:beta-galactosidase
MKDDSEYYVEFRVTEKAATFYADAGYGVARFQSMLKGAQSVALPMLPAAGVTAREDSESVTLEASGVTATVCKETGRIRLTKDGGEYLAFSGMPSLDRPYTGMDTFAGWGGMVNVFEFVRHGNTTFETDSVVLICPSAVAVVYKITTKMDTEGQRVISYATHTYTLRLTGALDVDFTIDLNPDIAYVPRAGMAFTLPAGFEKLTYYGLGDNDNYSDRQMSAYMAIHESTVTAQHFPFCPPSVCGGHGDTRWVSLANESGKRVTFTGRSPFHFDALHHTVKDYQQAMYDHELPKREETFLHIDAAHSGIGSNMSWSSHLEPAHLVPAKAYNLRFTVAVE